MSPYKTALSNSTALNH